MPWLAAQRVTALLVAGGWRFDFVEQMRQPTFSVAGPGPWSDRKFVSKRQLSTLEELSNEPDSGALRSGSRRDNAVKRTSGQGAGRTDSLRLVCTSVRHCLFHHLFVTL
jgi:hypothetical protein